MHAVPAPKPEQPDIIHYSEQEIRAMLSSLERSKIYRRAGQRETTNTARNTERNRAIILLLLDTGIRNEELCSLKLSALYKRNQRLYVFGKNTPGTLAPTDAATRGKIE